jgi:glycolate oxidase iron-sulfur subunit
VQTSFTLAQLADPDTAVSEKILRSCVHCGFCTATCPTYVLLGDELDSPRGRIYLIKDMLENDRPASEKVALHIDRCLSCLACMTTCPSGVDYMHLVDHARARIEETWRRPLAERTVRGLIAAVLPYPRRFRAALIAAFLGRPFLGLIRRIPGLRRLAPLMALAPKRLPKPPPDAGRKVFPADGERKGRVALLRGCAQSVLDPGINATAIRLLTRQGIEVVHAEGEGCCGALVHHMGRRRQSHAQAKQNIAAWSREIEAGGLDAILVTTSGCGTTLKDYGFLFRNEPELAEKAARVSALARDITEYLEGLGLGPPANPPGLTIAYHAACSLQHGQQVKTAPKALLAKAGFTVREPAEAHLCCGSAGTYNMLQPELSGRLRARKAANLVATGAEAIAAGNLGCMTQLAGAVDLPILHIVELLDWAYGGPRPESLSTLAGSGQRPVART